VNLKHLRSRLVLGPQRAARWSCACVMDRIFLETTAKATHRIDRMFDEVVSTISGGMILNTTGEEQ